MCLLMLSIHTHVCVRRGYACLPWPTSGPVRYLQQHTCLHLLLKCSHAFIKRMQAAVSLAWLKEFAKKHKVRERALTTGQIVDEVVKPLTNNGKCRMTDLLLKGVEGTATSVSQGKPFYFISHAWSCPFAETLNMVTHHFAPEQQLQWRRGPKHRGDGAATSGGNQPSSQALPLLSDEEAFVWFDMFAIVIAGPERKHEQHSVRDPALRQGCYARVTRVTKREPSTASGEQTTPTYWANRCRARPTYSAARSRLDPRTPQPAALLP
jgi:hypothetical protein